MIIVKGEGGGRDRMNVTENGKWECVNRRAGGTSWRMEQQSRVVWDWQKIC